MSFLKALSILCLMSVSVSVSVDGFLFHIGSRPGYTLRLESSHDGYEESSSTSSRKRRPTRIRPVRPSKKSANTSIEKRQGEARARHSEALKDPTLLTKLKFADRSDIHPSVKRAITEVFGLQSMTQIQAKTYEKALTGESILGKSRTGTGKTLAYLIPIVERLLEFDLDLYKPGRDIGAIIIAPTRELAIQIADQAKSLTSFINDFDVACIYGGTKMQRDMRLFGGPRMPSIVVATPGRILEHLDKTKVNRRKFCDIAEGTKIIVLDEADRMFESFPQETKKILSYLPRAKKRQTLLFSATIPNKLRFFLKNTMKIDYAEVDCVSSKLSNSETNLRAQQFFYQLQSMDEYISRLVGIIQREMSEEENYKVIVFFPAGRLVRFFSQLFNIGFGITVLEIHSRMSQASRNRASNSFREASRGFLFTSDVSARGIDYPEVSMVVQYGAPSTKDSYIHRLGRTARAGRQGKGLVVLLPFEKQQLVRIRQLGLKPDDMISYSLDRPTKEIIEETRSKIKSGHVQLTPNAEAAYRAFLAHYINSKSKMKPSEVLDYANQFAASTGLSSLPPIESRIASRLGLDGLVEEL